MLVGSAITTQFSHCPKPLLMLALLSVPFSCGCVDKSVNIAATVDPIYFGLAVAVEFDLDTHHDGFIAV